MTKLLITGIPATRKTTIGDYLEKTHGFLHLDLEIVGADLNSFNFKAGNKVITWGFPPGDCDDLVILLQKSGYKMIWFDSSDRKFAKTLYIKRARELEKEHGQSFEISMSDFDRQMQKIELMDLAKFNPIIIDTFGINGDILDEEKVCQEIFKEVGV